VRNGPSAGVGSPGTSFPPPPPIASGGRTINDGGRGGKRGARAPPAVGRPPPPPAGSSGPPVPPVRKSVGLLGASELSPIRSLTTPEAKKPAKNVQCTRGGGVALIRISGCHAAAPCACGRCFRLPSSAGRAAAFFASGGVSSRALLVSLSRRVRTTAHGITHGRHRGATRRPVPCSAHSAYGLRARTAPGAGALAAPPPHPLPGTPRALKASLTPLVKSHRRSAAHRPWW
jgi:hypothetical protein